MPSYHSSGGSSRPPPGRMDPTSHGRRRGARRTTTTTLPARSLLLALLAGTHAARGVAAAAPAHKADDAAFPQYRVPWDGGLYPRRLRGSSRRALPTAADDWHGRLPLSVVNNCGETIWPGVLTQNGTGPGTGGFELKPAARRDMWVSPNWQGRVWGRTNCTVSGDSCACATGDCFGVMDCKFSVGCPALRDASRVSWLV